MRHAILAALVALCAAGSGQAAPFYYGTYAEAKMDCGAGLQGQYNFKESQFGNQSTATASCDFGPGDQPQASAFAEAGNFSVFASVFADRPDISLGKPSKYSNPRG